MGSNIANELKRKYQISGVDLVDVKISGIKYDIYDVNNYAELETKIKIADPDVLIHTIAIVNVDKCEEEKELAENVNALLTEKVAEICYKNKIKMIYISTDAVFNGEEKDRKYEQGVQL